MKVLKKIFAVLLLSCIAISAHTQTESEVTHVAPVELTNPPSPSTTDTVVIDVAAYIKFTNNGATLASSFMPIVIYKKDGKLHFDLDQQISLDTIAKEEDEVLRYLGQSNFNRYTRVHSLDANIRIKSKTDLIKLLHKGKVSCEIKIKDGPKKDAIITSLKKLLVGKISSLLSP